MDGANEEKIGLREIRDLVINAGMQAIPYVGGPLATLYFGYKQEKRFKRLENFYNELLKKVNEMNITFPSLTSHNSDELNAIIEELHERIESENIEGKRKLYQNFYIKTLLFPVNGIFDERKLFLDILAELTPLQVELLVFISKQSVPIPDNQIVRPGTEQSVISGSIAQLTNYGLITSQLNGITIGGGTPGIQHKIYLSAFGKKFHDFCLKDA